MTLPLYYLSDEALTFTSERLRFMPIQESDVEILWPHMTNPDIARYMGWSVHESKERTRKFVARCIARMQQREVLHWTIWAGETFVALFSIIAIQHKRSDMIVNQGELGYWCAGNQQGKGYMTEAGLTLLDFAFTKAELHKMVVSHRADNSNSRRLIERMGFTLIGMQKEECYKDGSWHDQVLYEYLAREFANRNQDQT